MKKREMKLERRVMTDEKMAEIRKHNPDDWCDMDYLMERTKLTEDELLTIIEKKEVRSKELFPNFYLYNNVDCYDVILEVIKNKKK